MAASCNWLGRETIPSFCAWAANVWAAETLVHPVPLGKAVRVIPARDD
jgi:hypothetical protein